jgi:hypothetical protein
MKNDRFLNGLIAGIGILILIALVLFFVRQQQAEYRPGNEPNDVAHNYILGIMKRDFEKAYDYLAEGSEKPSLSQFQQELSRQANEINRANVTIGEVFVDGENASVQLNIRQSYERPLLTNASRYAEFAQLVLENGEWKLTSMPYPLWSWNWYYADPKPLP